MATDIKFGVEAREKMMVGFDKACDAAGATLGPCGRNVYIDDAVVPKITNDGHTIVSKLVLNDKLENMGAKIVQSSCARTVDEAGDGTTTTAVLLQAIMKEALKRPENPMIVRKSLLEALPKVVSEIKRHSKKIGVKDIKKVALISSEDEVLATAISDIINKVGADSVITIEDALDNTTSYSTTDGYELYSGFLDPRFINKEGKAQCVMENVAVVVSEKKISAMVDLMAILTKCQEAGVSECVFIVEDIDTAVLGQLVVNKMLGRFSSVVIRAVGDSLKDVEACVGATRISDSTGISFQTFSVNHFGRCKKVIANHQKTLFMPEDSKKSRAYATMLREKAAEERNQFIRDRIIRRASQMTGGVAVLKIGSPDFNREYLKDKADDAVKASKSALEEGIVEGGGMCLYRIAEAIKPTTVGLAILKNALSAPLRKILENAGLDYASIVKSMPDGFGYDAKEGTYKLFIESGIIDPTKVERCAVTNAVSNAANLITSHASIYEYSEPAKVQNL